MGQNERPRPRWNRWIAGVLSFFIPGLGQLYKGRVLAAVLWFVLTAAGYALFVVPGVILHVCCVAGALMGDPYKLR